MVNATVLGTGLAFDAFVVAWTVPNLFRRLFGEGAFSSAFIPVYTDHLEKGDKKNTQNFLNSVFSMLVAVLFGIIAIVALAGGLLGFLAPLPEKWELALRLFPLLVPYVLPVCLVALAAAILNTHGHFAMPAFAPVLLNAFWIVTLGVALLATDDLSVIVAMLAAGVLVAGAVQFAVQIPVLRRKGVRLRFRPDFSHPGLRSVRRIMAPAVFGVAVFQINAFLDNFIAMTFVEKEGGVGTLFYANRMVQFPLALIGIAVATAAFPTLSRLVSERNARKFALTVKESILGVLFVAVPASVGLALLSTPIIRLLFERGKFTPASTERTAFTLACYAATVAAASAFHLATRAFHSLKDTVTPVRVGAAMVLLNLTLNMTLVWSMQEAGLALATSISSACNVIVLLVLLKRKTPELDVGSLGRGFLRFCAVSAAMGVAVLGMLHILPAPQSLLLKLAAVGVPMIAGVLVLFILSGVFRFPELSFILRSIGRKRTA